MAFGFGFNKTKVLSAAERHVQQGKLQNAIAEYEKIAKEDPKDLTVLNTIGDLCARIGQSDRAAGYFRKVGDAYAADGFTVKAIAMYKKLTKLNPSATDCILKLAELYSQQGLYNDARSQYVQVAEHHLRAGDLEQAARIFQKMLELDPDNTAMQAKLADIYVRLGKKPEARDIFFRAAESLLGKGARPAADEALAKVLGLEPDNSRALLARGQIALDNGDGAAAAQHLEKIAQIDSMPDALAALLRAHLMVGQLDQAEPIAKKLLTVHNDLAGIHAYADALISAGACERAVTVYHDYADRLLAADPAGLADALRSTISRVKENPAALELLRIVYQKAGDTTHIAEVTELLAQALVQTGELEKARQLYQELGELEPENPQHAQSYKQIIARLGLDSVARPLTQEEGAQALMAEELEFTAPAIEQQYPKEIAAILDAAITDAELFSSYNQPAKAIVPLEGALATAPYDVRLNQRLASLFARAERFADAARSCAILQKLYSTAGFDEQARQYGEMAAKYAQRAGLPGPPAIPDIPVMAPVPPAIVEEPSELRQEVEHQPAAPERTPAVAAAPPAFEVTPAPAPEPPIAATAHEIDLSEEWESAAVVESASAAPQVEAAAADLIEEARFYLAQSMWDEARGAIARCEQVAPRSAALTELKQQLAAAAVAPPPADIEVVPEPEPEPAPPAKPTVSQFVFDAAAIGVPPARPSAPPAPVPARTEVPAASAATPIDSLSSFASDLEQALPQDFAAAPPPLTMTTAAAAAPTASLPASEVTGTGSEATSALSDIFAEFKSDVEDTTDAAAEDPETHYNLGVAFKEMGLLDEAIGELQKVCHAIEHGHAFAQTMQAYTWLAQCFVEKGVPEAGVRWYEKALKLRTDDDSSMALHYELACAHQAAGNRPAALSHFMEVYGANIDYRDVAERIKALKS